MTGSGIKDTSRVQMKTHVYKSPPSTVSGSSGTAIPPVNIIHRRWDFS